MGLAFQDHKQDSHAGRGAWQMVQIMHHANAKISPSMFVCTTIFENTQNLIEALTITRSFRNLSQECRRKSFKLNLLLLVLIKSVENRLDPDDFICHKYKNKLTNTGFRFLCVSPFHRERSWEKKNKNKKKKHSLVDSNRNTLEGKRFAAQMQVALTMVSSDWPAHSE